MAQITLVTTIHIVRFWSPAWTQWIDYKQPNTSFEWRIATKFPDFQISSSYNALFQFRNFLINWWLYIMNCLHLLNVFISQTWTACHISLVKTFHYFDKAISACPIAWFVNYMDILWHIPNCMSSAVYNC